MVNDFMKVSAKFNLEVNITGGTALSKSVVSSSQGTRAKSTSYIVQFSESTSIVTDSTSRSKMRRVPIKSNAMPSMTPIKSDKAMKSTVVHQPSIEEEMKVPGSFTQPGDLEFKLLLDNSSVIVQDSVEVIKGGTESKGEKKSELVTSGRSKVTSATSRARKIHVLPVYPTTQPSITIQSVPELSAYELNRTQQSTRKPLVEQAIKLTTLSNTQSLSSAIVPSKVLRHPIASSSVSQSRKADSQDVKSNSYLDFLPTKRVNRKGKGKMPLVPSNVQKSSVDQVYKDVLKEIGDSLLKWLMNTDIETIMPDFQNLCNSIFDIESSHPLLT